MIGPRCALVLGLRILCQPARALPTAATWPHERSDLAPDPAVHWGRLPNGLRYALRPNAEPKGRISLRFLVQVGSMDENDDERGLAHFIEHLAFRHTGQHPDGSLPEELQRLGIAFGPDNTAFTTYDYTIYHLELPNDRADTLREGLRVFREYADDIVFSAADIERERGVVLSEMAMRDTPAAHVYQSALEFLVPQARQTVRAPIGLETQIRHFTPEQFQAFYAAWYRPERMIVSIVGSIDPAAAERLVRAVFATLVARGPVRPEPPATLAPAAGRAARPVGIFTEPTIVGLDLTFEHVQPEPDRPETRAQLTRDLQTSLAFNMLQQRLTKLALRRGTSFITPGVNFGTYVDGWRVSSVTLPSKLLAWRLVVADGEQELRRACDYGFTARELDEARKTYTNYYDQAVRSAATVSSETLATQIVVSTAYDRLFSSAAIMQKETAPMIRDATLADCQAAFRAAWGDGPPRVFIGANANFRVSAADVAGACAYSRRVEVLPPVARAAVAFAYTDFGPAGTLVRREHLADLDVSLTQFGNGTRFNFKHTGFEADTVLVNVRVGHGRLTQPAKQPGLDYLANYGLLAGGLGRHTNAELSDIFYGHIISLNFGVASDSFDLTVRCARRELRLGLETLAAYLTDAAYRPEAIRAARAGYGSLFESLSASPGGPIFAEVSRVLASGDSRFGVPAMDALARRNLAELRAWVEPEFKHGPLEVSVVGDVDLATAEAEVARTLGALPRRADPSVVPDHVKIAQPSPKPLYSPIDPKFQQSGVALVWAVPHLAGVHDDRRCRLLASLVEERLRQRVREDLGAAYAVTTQFFQTDGFPTLNYFQTYAEVASAQAADVNRLILRELADLRRDGLTPDEFARAREPFLAQREADLRSNAYWGYTVLRDAQEKPERIAAARDRAADTGAITLVELQALLDRYLDPAAAFSFRTVPNR
ncbi:MAG: M16 family metallopeptidase [Opitutales bacterium]